MKYNVNQPEQEPVNAFCSNQRYPILRSMISCYKLLAWVVIVGAVMVSIFTGFLFDLKQAISVILLALFFGIVGFINFMAASEAILVFLDIEENTRICKKVKSSATGRL